MRIQSYNMIRNHWNFVMHFLAKKLPELNCSGSISALLGPGQKFFELFAYYTLVPEGTGQKFFELFGLPDNHSLLLWKEHGSVGDAEGIVEGLDVAEGCVHAVLAERVHVNLCQAGSLLVADVLAPDGCV